MEDVIIDDRRQLSAKAVNREQQEVKKQKPRRSFRRYLVDFLLGAIIATLLVYIDFTMFTEAGSYSLFSSSRHLNTEAIYIFSGLAIVFFLIAWMCSFARWFQHLLTAAVFGLFIFAVFNQFAVFDKGSFLAGTIGNWFNTGIAYYFATSSHIIISLLAAFAFWLFLIRAHRSTLGYFTGILLLIWGGLLSDAYFNPVSHNFKTIYEPYKASSEANTPSVEPKRFIFLGIPDLASATTLRGMLVTSTNQQEYNNTIQTALDSMLGFYAQNNFNYFPHAYASGKDTFLNLTMSFNPVDFDEDPQENTLNNVLLQSYWDFNQLSTPKLYLKNNKLFDSFRKNKYAIKAYQTRGLESCYINNQWEVNKCVAKQNLPMNFENTNLTTLQKTALLSAQWLESTGLVSNFSVLSPAFKLISRGPDTAAIDFQTDKLYVANAAQTFDLLNRDIKNEQGDTAYFAIIDLPADLYIYDQNCQLKPMSKWIAAGATTDATAQKQAYAEQTTCLFGQLENFIQELSNSGKLSSSVIIIQGLNAPQLGNAPQTDTFEQVKAEHLVNMAIFDPLQQNYNINNATCLAPAILKSYLYKKSPCTEFELLPLMPLQQKELVERLNSDSFTDTDVMSSVSNFINWYDSWAKANKVQNSLNSVPLPQPAPVEAVETPQVILDVPVTATTDELQVEAPVESLSEAMQENPLEPEKPDLVPESEPKTNAEIIQLDSQSEIKVKVIDNQAAEAETEVEAVDVIPPFVSDLPRSKPTETEEK